MAKILLAGATGLVGGEVLALLLADHRVSHVVAPTRRPLPAHSKLLNPIHDSRDLPSDAPWWAADGAICAIGTTRAKTPSAQAYRAIDFDYALAVATRARRGGAARFAMVTAMGADVRSCFRYGRTKGELEAAVTALGFPSLTIIRPGFLGGVRPDAGPMERIVGRILRMAAPILPMSARISPAATVAAFLVEAAIQGGAGTSVMTSADIACAAAYGRVSVPIAPLK
ncbi:MAG: NAD-dependent dehydratase [bacterium]|nr:NAD-dependent dehydratase [bacterium]